MYIVLTDKKQNKPCHKQSTCIKPQFIYKHVLCIYLYVTHILLQSVLSFLVIRLT